MFLLVYILQPLFFQIPPDPHSTDPSLAENQSIVSLTISPSEEIVVAATDHSQLYSIALASADLGKGKLLFVTYTFLPWKNSYLWKDCVNALHAGR